MSAAVLSGALTCFRNVVSGACSFFSAEGGRSYALLSWRCCLPPSGNHSVFSASSTPPVSSGEMPCFPQTTQIADLWGWAGWRWLFRAAFYVRNSKPLNTKRDKRREWQYIEWVEMAEETLEQRPPLGQA
ncbi:hypothetical protein FPQ18DRAFT_359572 [Pyronema domesticum]|nr:hypothetical protein FPQ18DRAFT_359572 [Pyronema domesticum]